MIVYRDRTFCTAKKCKNTETCDTFLTEQHKQKAEELRLCISVYTTTLDCFEDKENTEC
jgi:hypothetical protein